MSHRVFISYCHEDSEVARQVCSGLEAEGIGCWMAPRNVRPGENWGRSIIKALGSSKAMVLIFSRHTNESRHVNNEIERAVSHRVPIIPFRIEKVQPSEDLELFISSCHWLDAVQPPLEKKIEELALAVRAVVGPEEAASTPEPAPQAPAADAPGTSGELAFHHYVVMHKDDGTPWEIGRGAMGVTYKAMDSRLRRKVALKVVSSERLSSGSAREKFLLEAQATAALQHPNIASIYYFGEQNGACFYAMEYVDGATLDDLVQQNGPLETGEALAIASQAAAALGAAHETGMVHRDIKPSNIMVIRKADGSLSVRVIDFGLAAAAGGETQGFEGTPLYASPEQLDQGAVDARSDVYSLGVALYFALAGHPPYQGTTSQIASRQIMEPFPAAGLHGKPPEVINLVARMLDADPAGRPQNGGEARSEIEGVARDLHRAGEQTSMEWMATYFKAIEKVGPIEGGSIFRVAATPGAEELAVLCFDTSARGLAVADRVREVAPVIQSLSAPAVRQVRAMAEVKDGLVLVTEWLSGTRLLSVLRVRRVLGAHEAGNVLSPLADALDEAAGRGLPLPQLTLREILLQPGEKPETPLDQWPGIRPVLDLLPVGEATEADVNTTITSSSALAQVTSYEASERSPAALIGSLAYELLGGMSSPGLGPYVPLAELSQEANAVLREIFQNPQPSGSASALVAQLLPAKKVPTPRGDVAAAAPAAKQGKFRRRADIAPQAFAQAVSAPPVAAPARAPRRRLLIGAATAGVLMLGGLAFLFASRPATTGGKDASPRTNDQSAITQGKSQALETPSAVLTDTALEKAKELENAQDFVGALIVYKDMLRSSPGNKEIRARAENAIARLEEKSESLAKHSELRLALQDLAEADLARAATLLGDLLEDEDPWESFRLFRKAAELGDRHAMVLTGLALASGKGTDKSEGEAAKWFKQASDLGQPEGMRYYAEVLRDGQGVEMNQQEAARLYSAAATLGDVPSKAFLGDLYRRGIGVPAVDYEAAFRLFTEAIEAGYFQAQGDLAAMYLQGQGTEANPEKAMSLLKGGAEKGDPQCMYLYGLIIYDGAFAPPDVETGKEWLRKSANLEHPPAIQWHIDNNIPF